MLRLLLLIIAITLTATQLYCEGGLYTLFAQGSFHGDEVSVKDGEKCIALVVEDNKTKLILTEVKIEKFFDVVLDREGEKTGKKVSGSVESPLIFIKGLEFNGSEKNVPTSFHGKRELKKGDEIDISLTGGSKTILRVINDKVTISDGKISQVIGNIYPERYETTYSLVWAGDIDRDGKVDILVDDRYHYNIIVNYILFLSSEADAGNMVKQVASFRAVGC